MNQNDPRLKVLSDMFLAGLGLRASDRTGLIGGGYRAAMTEAAARWAAENVDLLSPLPTAARPRPAPQARSVTAQLRTQRGVEVPIGLNGIGLGLPGGPSPWDPAVRLPRGLTRTAPPESTALSNWPPETVDRPEPPPIDPFGTVAVGSSQGGRTPVGAAGQAGRAKGASGGGLNGFGYVPRAGDANTLARMIFAEGSNTSEDYEAIGWSIVNRIGQPGFRPTLDEVIHQPRQFASQPEGGSRDPGGSNQWKLSAHPEAMDPRSAASWKQAVTVANGILDGKAPDPTDGATYFFSSNVYDGRPETAQKGFFANSLKKGSLVPTTYRSRSSLETRNYFFKPAR